MKRILATLTGLILFTAAQAAEINVISGGAIEPGLRAAAAAFEKQAGHKVKFTFNTTPQMRKRVAAGDTFDVIIAPPAAVKDFAAAGKVEAGGVDVGRASPGTTCRFCAVRRFRQRGHYAGSPVRRMAI